MSDRRPMGPPRGWVAGALPLLPIAEPRAELEATVGPIDVYPEGMDITITAAGGVGSTFALEFADGSLLDDGMIGSTRTGEAARHGLLPLAAGGDGALQRRRFWLTPLPAGPISFVVRPSSQELPEVRVTVDGDTILRAARDARPDL